MEPLVGAGGGGGGRSGGPAVDPVAGGCPEADGRPLQLPIWEEVMDESGWRLESQHREKKERASKWGRLMVIESMVSAKKVS